MMRVINGFYDSRLDVSSTSGQAILVSTVDSASGNMKGGGKLIAVRWNTLVFNLIEAGKSLIKLRPPVFRRVSLVDVRHKGTYYFNFRNGTAVVLAEGHVHKLYFKDVSFFFNLYAIIGPTCGMQVILVDGVTIVRQRRHGKISLAKNSAEILISIFPSLKRFRELSAQVRACGGYFSIEYKVRQLFAFYNMEQDISLSAYLDVAETLQLQADRYETVLCHGDLWEENILKENEDDGSRIALVDFDKAVLFVPAYDPVHFFVMCRVPPARFGLEPMLLELNSHARSAAIFLEYECEGKVGFYEEDEIRLSLFLFLFLKLVERDLRHKVHGKSLPPLVAALNRLVGLL